MEDVLKKFKVGYYLDLVSRRRWLIIILFCAFMVMGICLALVSPETYMAKTFIKVVPKSIPKEYVPEVSELDISERIATIIQEIKSRTNIEKLIEKHGLFKGKKYEKMYIEDKIEAVRKKVSVSVKKSRRAGVNSFTISYRGKDPELVMNIVNDLANSFIDASLKVMGEEVLGTKDFLESVLDEKRKKLDEIKDIIKEYREKHKGELPEQLNTSLQTLTRLQEQQIAKHESLRDAKFNLIQVEKDMAGIRNRQNQLDKELTEIRERQKQLVEKLAEPVVEPESENVKKLNELKQQYSALLLRYTGKHPEIVRLKGVIENFEKTVAQELLEKAETKPEPIKTEIPMSPAVVAQIIQIEKQIDELIAQHSEMAKRHEELSRDIRIDSEDISKLQEQIREYERRVENTPKRELDLLTMRSSYKPVEKSYEALLEKKEDAMIAVNMEQRQKGQKFQIIDKAKKPQRPVSPDLKKYFAIFLVAGLAVGGGLTFLLDVLDTSVRSPEDIETLLEVSTIITIPKIYSKKEQRVKAVKTVLSFFALMTAFMLSALFSMLASKGVERTMKLIPPELIAFAKKIMASI
ncbi:MAG: hypothetical protein GY795_32460 [Desulfobacterales bacterium]|nr:hypothetical protein [Desulfobacterales bacterium]